MTSKRLKAAVIAQLAAGAALVMPAAAHWQPDDCLVAFDQVCDGEPKEIWWGPDDYTLIVDG